MKNKNIQKARAITDCAFTFIESVDQIYGKGDLKTKESYIKNKLLIDMSFDELEKEKPSKKVVNSLIGKLKENNNPQPKFKKGGLNIVGESQGEEIMINKSSVIIGKIDNERILTANQEYIFYPKTDTEKTVSNGDVEMVKNDKYYSNISTTAPKLLTKKAMNSKSLPLHLLKNSLDYIKYSFDSAL